MELSEKGYFEEPLYAQRFMRHESPMSKQMCFIQYMPIKFSNSRDIKIPGSLTGAKDLINASLHIVNKFASWKDKSIYVTLKTLFVSSKFQGNRPGWHSDGFMTDDLNVIWCDKFPTDFLELPVSVRLPQDHVQSMKQMEGMALMCHDSIAQGKANTLYLLDETVIHKVTDMPDEPELRTFFKLSISDKYYNLMGNAINTELQYPDDWEFVERTLERNCPIGKK